MNIQFIILLVYIISLFSVSWFSTKLAKGKGSEGFLLAGRGMPPSVIAVMIAGLAVGGASTVGVAESAYTKGISAGMYNAAWAAGAAFAGLIVVEKFREMKITTIPELLGNYYGKTGKLIGVIGQLIIQIVITSLQYIAGASILTALLPEIFSFQSGMITTAIVFVGITLIGGFWAAGLSNLINVTMIYIGLSVGAITAVLNLGGMSNLVSKLSQNTSVAWFNPVSGVGMSIVVAWFVVMITQCMSNQGCVQMSFASKDAKSAKKGYLLGALIILPVGFVASLYGMVAAVQFPNLSNAAMALPNVVMSLNPLVAGLTLSALWAADVSTAVGLLLGSSTLVITEFKEYKKTDMTEKQELIFSRIIILIVSVLTYILASTVVGILSTLLVGLSLTTAFTVIILFTMFAPKLCKKSSATWTLLAGIFVLFMWMFIPESRIVSHPIFIEWPVCLGTFLLVSVFDKNQANIETKKIKETTPKVKQPVNA